MFSLDRRAFLSVLAGAAACSSEPPATTEAGTAAAPSILDFHCHTLHLGRTNEQLVAHQAALGVTKTVLLPGAGWLLERIGGNESCAELAKTDPAHFVLFANADSAEDNAVATLATWLDGDARGIGEQKFNVPVDGTEMRRIFDLTRERKVPVLVHFEHETYNLGIQNFSKILEEYHDVTFLGHAQTWWANIGAEQDQADMYPTGPVKPGGLIDRLLADYPNIYGDLSAGSGRNALTRDKDFARGFVERHQNKLVWGTDCPCPDAKGTGRSDGTCIGAGSLQALKDLVPNDEAYRKIVWGNGTRILGS
jgi:predicted TIM-barrel fold metal-dependent hydrolase